MDFTQLLEALEVDREKTLARMGGMEKILEKFLIKFLDDGTFAMLAQAVADKDAEAVEQGVHTLKGMSANLGLDKLSGICAEGMVCLREGREEDFPPIYEQITQEYERVTGLLQKYKK